MVSQLRSARRESEGGECQGYQARLSHQTGAGVAQGVHGIPHAFSPA